MAGNPLVAGSLGRSALLSTAGCTTMAIGRSRGAARTPWRFFRADGLETPEVRVTWVRHIASEELIGQAGQAGPLRTFTTEVPVPIADRAQAIGLHQSRGSTSKPLNRVARSGSRLMVQMYSLVL
jgi:hypothetical protein